MKRFLPLLVTAFCFSTAAVAAPVGQSFSYQGELVLNGDVINENCDFEFSLWDAPVAGNQIGATETQLDVELQNGRFSTMLNAAAQFGSSPFSGEARFLQIAVRHPAGVGPFVPLNGRQEMAPTPFAIGLSLPFQGIAENNLGSAFEIVNNDMGWAATFRNNNPANPDAALNVTSMGGPAGQFLNDSGGTSLVSRAVGSGVAFSATAPGSGGSSAIHSVIDLPGAPAGSAAVRADNMSLNPATYGLLGTSAGSGYGVYGKSLSGYGVFGEATSDFGFGVYGRAMGRNGIGVYGIHPDNMGVNPGVDGLSQSMEAGAAGVRGRSTATSGGTAGGPNDPPRGGSGNPTDPRDPHDAAALYGVLGQSIAGIGVRGEGPVGVEGEGDEAGVTGIANDIGGYGVYGEGTYGVYGVGNDGAAGVTGVAGNSATIGIHAIGEGSALSAPALRADNLSGTGVFAMADRAIEGEGGQFGVRGATWDENGYGGVFTNFEGGIALRSTGDAVVDGTLTVNVLEILGGADLAERFTFSEDAEPGMVVEIDPAAAGNLQVSKSAYNKRVAGVISGANELDAGVVLGVTAAGPRDLPVALSGRVWVKCDTRQRGIEAGDLLTTSDMAGYAMPVIDRDKADGAIIGKAMSSLAQGEEGLVLVLVNLQ